MLNISDGKEDEEGEKNEEDEIQRCQVSGVSKEGGLFGVRTRLISGKVRVDPKTLEVEVSG